MFNSVLREGAEEVCAQLCAAVTGDFDFRVETGSSDETIQRLSMLANFVLDAARRAVEGAAARAAAEARTRELRDAHRIARLGTWRHDLVTDSLNFSEELRDLFGWPEASPLEIEDILRLAHRDDHDAVRAAFTRPFSVSEKVEHQWRMRLRSGEIAWFWAETRPERDGAGKTIAIRGVCQDVTERRATAERLNRLANYDDLTGLANRTLLNQRLNKAIAYAQRATNGRFSVLCVNLDGFKAVNDLHGHAAGDSLLKRVAGRLSRCVRETDAVARLGGDDFVILCEGQGEPAETRALCERVLATIAQPYALGLNKLRATVTASIGAAIFPGDGATAETLLHNAEIALHRAKHAGRNSFASFCPEMHAELRAQRELERDLRQAVTRGELRLMWQPLAKSADATRITGFEVLLRWQHPERGLVMPDKFIPLAESCGAIEAIGTWVLQEACMEAARWTVPLRVAVNVSPLQAQKGDSFAEIVEAALTNAGLAPDRLVLEVTESAVIREADQVLAALRRLKALGVGVALDDFGTGYSSLATLRAFPFDKIKIDRSFVAGMTSAAGERDAAIVRAVLGLARGLRLPVVAEGVETIEQLEALHDAGCDEVQGWLVGRPLPIDTFARNTHG